MELNEKFSKNVVICILAVLIITVFFVYQFFSGGREGQIPESDDISVTTPIEEQTNVGNFDGEIINTQQGQTYATSNGSILSGTWEGFVGRAPEPGVVDTIEFSGNMYTATHYIMTTTYSDASSNNVVGPRLVRGGGQFLINTDDEFASKELIYSVSDTYELQGVDITLEVNIFRITAQGTYSLSDGRIEFLRSDNTVRVYDISYTQNTMIINPYDHQTFNYVRTGINR